MEEKELTKGFHETFEALTPILEKVYKGFVANNQTLIQESLNNFHNTLNAKLPFVEKIITEKDKDQVEKKFVNMVLAFQTVALAIDNLVNKMLVKAEAKILFSEKATKEIKTLLHITYSQFRDAKDYISTQNPILKNNIKDAKEKLVELIADYDVVHQNRLISGVCMPKASYLYIDITDSLKRISRGLVDLVEKV
ncbi:MAG: hypothetical protein BWX58_00732 [Deltaproteobacteria bacterium ADurb.Bin026]|jgi:Na+/phosphate symporter|nr:MAG: hypothetical protein BWX58_00732 [Deltaproteobacteria bacterium ADurb.Bin026]